MTGEGFFLDISKIAVTFAGFASVVGALRHPHNEGWTKRDVVGLTFMIEHSAAAIIIGLLPFPVFYYFSDETIVWATCSWLLAGFLIAELLAHIKRIKDISLSGFPPRQFGLMISTYFLPSLATTYCLVQNAVSWRRPTILAAAAIVLLFWCFMQFYVFVLAVEPQMKKARLTAMPNEALERDAS